MNFREHLEKMRIGNHYKKDESVEHYDEYDFLNAPREINDYHQFSQNIGAEENGRITPEYISSIINRQIYNKVFRPIDDIVDTSSSEVFDRTTDELEKVLYHLNALFLLGFDTGLLSTLKRDIEKELRRREHGDDDNYFRVS